MNFKFWRRSDDDWLGQLGPRFRSYDRPEHSYGMTTANELCMVETYARERFTGRGRIVDLGCWYGATTLSLARGLQQNRRAQSHRRIDALDLFRWEQWMDPIAREIGLPKRYEAGQSFYDDVKDLLSPFGDLVKVEQHDLHDYDPPTVPIEFLFIDAMKDWDLARQIVSGFFPHLIANNGYVVQQDFAYYLPEMATNHLIMWYLRHHFECIYHVPASASVVFRCTRPVLGSSLPVFEPGLFTPEMVEKAYAYSLGCVSREMQPLIETAKLNFLIEQHRHDEARRQMRHLSQARMQLTDRMIAEVRRVTALAVLAEEPSRWTGEIDAWAASMRLP
jgi:hypothetical protein